MRRPIRRPLAFCLPLRCSLPIAWSLGMLFLAGGLPAVAQAAATSSSLHINEIMASNSSVLADPQSQFDDWIEVYNPSPIAVDMAGMYLTDDLDEPAKWRLPTNRPELTTIAAGGFVLIWADGDVRDQPGLHAGFSINADGEQIGLFGPDGITAIDTVTFAAQRPDISFGRYPNGNDTWQFMAQPTPGAPNVSRFQGFVEEVTCSRDRGFYDEPFFVTLSTDTEDTAIWFTTDGSEPYTILPRKVNGTLYTGPVEISGTTCLRVKAIKPGWAHSIIRTHTYIFLDDVLHQPRYPSNVPRTWGEHAADYAMDARVLFDPLYAECARDAFLTHRTISLTCDALDVFGPTQGIYSQPQQEGIAWERPVSVEIIDPCDGPEIHVNAGLRIQGGASRNPNRPKHNLRLLFKGIYGATKLEFPMFGGWPVQQFDTLILRGGNGDSWFHPNTIQQIRAQYIRDQWPRDTQRAMGRLACGQCYVHLYLNGLYWGLYHVIERPNASFFAAHLGGEPDQYDVVQHKNGTVDGNRQAWNAMMAIANGGLASPDAYAEIQQYLDLPNFIDWLLINFYMGNVDWDHNNWYGGRRRVAGAGFRFLPWDSERTFLDLNHNVTGKDNANQPTHVHQQLRANADYRMLFADHAHRHLFNDGVLTVESARARWLKRAEEIRPALVAEAARWGDAKRPDDPYTPEAEWQAELDSLCDEYFPQRTEIVLDQLRAQNLYPAVEPPAFNVRGGPVPTGFHLSMSAPSGAIWFTTDGSDPRLPQTHPSDATTRTLVSEDAPKRVLVPTAAVTTDWRGPAAFDDSAWLLVEGGPGGIGYERGSGYQGYVSGDVGDLMYAGNTTCYIRVALPFDRLIGDWDAMTLRIRYDDGFVAYLNGVEIARRNFDGDPSWDSRAASGHSDSQAVQLENIDVSACMTNLLGGENVLALHGLNVSSTSSDFLISAELRLSKGGSPADVNPRARQYTGAVTLNSTARVKARTLGGGTWSALSEAVFAVGPVAESLRVSEIMYHPADTGSPDDPNTEYVELTNVGDETINLNLVSFTNGIDFTFGSFELAPGDYCLLVKDVAAFEAKYGAGLNVAGQYAGSLNNAGERVELQDAAGAVIHNFRYEDNWFDLTDGGGFSLTVRDPLAADLDGKSAWRPSAYVGGSPGYDDAGEVPQLGTVVINELLANPTSDRPDWIELHNTTNQAIDIGGWFLSDDGDNLTKYEIAAGVTIPPGGYLVFDQDHHFDNRDDPGCHDDFALSRDGETVYLHSGAEGLLTGYSEQEKFDASDPGVSLGRYLKSTGTYNFVALSAPTPGAENAYPQVGPVVITEIMYHPADAGDAEYVELLNVSNAAVTLYDAVRAAPWRFTDDPDDPGIEFLFPADPPVTLAPNEYLVLAKDADLVAAKYAISAGVQVFTWGAGNLANGSEKIQLSKPGDEDNDERHSLRVDRVVYSDGSHHEDFPSGTDPWPTAADGLGSSLIRTDPTTYGNDPTNWQASTPSPGY